ncbi:DNA repair protein [Arthrobacter sp. SW1]|uniref:alpha-ketoglutarate-dependent dioxygenase AlkB family protein n=1 Tax=Arthrobacter sp. SW1 TaxID=1920889 RepID=UPI000877D449|nr:alpha-ketoglutarate-dependent dioxygenase AlkB [Arthrobacter sp. SW1]OFI36464.1 DNA repair protein [Arthrobacter sp. SW1]
MTGPDVPGEALFPAELISVPDAGPHRIAEGAVHVPGWLDTEQQRWIVDRFREWAAGPVPPRAAVLPGGHPMSVQTVCLGWHWQPYRYTREAFDVNGRRVLDFPDWMVRLGRKALAAAGAAPETAAGYTPDTALVNYYGEASRMGMHQDKDERSAAPVVSLSIGDSCVFRFGNTGGRGKPHTDITLRSGDLFVFGGASRFAYHGVVKVHPGTAPAECGLDGGRINITMRVTGMS